MQLHEIQLKTKRKTKKIVGRGGKRGKTSGRGTKGQKARAGHRIRPAIRDVIKKLPKRRGEGVSRNRFSTPRESFAVVDIRKIGSIFSFGDAVNPKSLVLKGLIKKRANRIPCVKILGNAEIDKKFIVRGCLFSQKVKTLIENAGGSIR